VCSTTCWLRSCGSHRPRWGSASPGASGAPEHVREDHRCGHEVLRRRELRWGRRDFSPSAPPSVVHELRLDSGFAVDPTTFAGGFSAPRVQQHPQAQGPHTYVQRSFAPPGVGTFSRPHFQLMHDYCGFVIILYSNRTGRLLPFSSVGPRQQEPPPIYTLGGSRPPTFQFPATDIPSSSTPPKFQPSTFDTAAEHQLAWDEYGYNDILATMDGGPQQADEVGASQLTQPLKDI
jgi:hypothetical protein